MLGGGGGLGGLLPLTPPYKYNFVTIVIGSINYLMVTIIKLYVPEETQGQLFYTIINQNKTSEIILIKKKKEPIVEANYGNISQTLNKKKTTK